MHKYPVLKARLSQQNVKYLVSCGSKSDASLKLRNIANKEEGEINQVKTNQSVIKQMAYSAETNMLAVAAESSEIKLFKMCPPARPKVGHEIVLEKALTLINHKSEVLWVSMHGLFCASVARDQRLLVSRIDPA